jgi:hypothetical protein
VVSAAADGAGRTGRAAVNRLGRLGPHGTARPDDADATGHLDDVGPLGRLGLPGLAHEILQFLMFRKCFPVGYPRERNANRIPRRFRLAFSGGDEEYITRVGRVVDTFFDEVSLN